MMNRRRQEIRGRDTEERCWRLYVDTNGTVREIAAALGITPGAVSKALRRAQTRAEAQLQSNIGNHRAIALARLLRLYGLAMAAYADSISERTRRRTKRRTTDAGDATETEIVTEARLGNPRYLAEARMSLDSIKKLLGLDAPAKLSLVDPDRPFAELSDADLQIELLTTLRAAGLDPSIVVAPEPARPQ